MIEREDDGFVALWPELDIACQGLSIEEARTNLTEALTLFFETAVIPVGVPRTQAALAPCPPGPPGEVCTGITGSLPRSTGEGKLSIASEQLFSVTLKAREEGSMASLDWTQCPAVERVPGKRSGAWVFRDTRTPVSVVFENLEVGATISEVMEWFHLSHEQVTAVLEFAVRSLDAPPGMQSPTPTGNAHTFR